MLDAHNNTRTHVDIQKSHCTVSRAGANVGSLAFKNCSFHSDSLSLPVSGYKCINTHQTLRSSPTQLFCYCRASARNNWFVKSLALVSPLTLLSRPSYMIYNAQRCT